MAQLTEHKTCYRLIEGSNIDQWLETLDFKVISRTTEEFFDTQDGSFYKRGIFISLKNSQILEIKSNPAHLSDGQETNQVQFRNYRFPVPFDADKMSDFNELEALIGLKRPRPFLFSYFLTCNSLRSFVTLDKTCKMYRISTAPLITIAVNQFSGLGTFVEFEAINSKAPYSIEAFMKDVTRLIKNLPFLPFNANYVELALRETEAELYLQKRLFIGA